MAYTGFKKGGFPEEARGHLSDFGIVGWVSEQMTRNLGGVAITNMRKKIARPADTPPEVYDYWHQRWAEYLNRHCKERFVQAGVVNMSFTEKCPDCPDGSGGFHYQFASDGTLEFTDQVGEAIVEYASYDIAYRLLGDADYDSMELLGKGSLRFVEKAEHFVKLAELISLLREAFYAALADAEKKFNVEMPKYL